MARRNKLYQALATTTVLVSALNSLMFLVFSWHLLLLSMFSQIDVDSSSVCDHKCFVIIAYFARCHQCIFLFLMSGSYIS